MTIEIKPMTEDDINELFSQANALAHDLGFKNYYAMEEYKHYACEGMQKRGGSFTEMLGRALAHADMINTYLILKTWPNMVKEHYELYTKKSEQ